MHLKIKTLKGQTFGVDIDGSATFYELKNLIKKVKSVPVDLQKIIYKGKAMENQHILLEIGVRQEDTLVLMQTIHKKNKNVASNSTVEKDSKKQQQQKNSNKQQKDKSGKEKHSQFEQKITQLEAMGYSREKCTQYLSEADGNLQKAVIGLAKEGGSTNLDINNMIKQQIFKALKENEQLLQGQNGEGIAELGVDLQSLANSLGEKNQELKRILLENPEAIGQLLFDNLEQQLDDEISEEQSPQMHEMELTEEQQQSIQKLMSLGFEREDVIQVFFACEKNEQMAANMLFDRQANGDFDDLG